MTGAEILPVLLALAVLIAIGGLVELQLRHARLRRRLARVASERDALLELRKADLRREIEEAMRDQARGAR